MTSSISKHKKVKLSALLVSLSHHDTDGLLITPTVLLFIFTSKIMPLTRLLLILWSTISATLAFLPQPHAALKRQHPSVTADLFTINTCSNTQLFGVDQARKYVSEGMSAFRQGHVSESIQLFDSAEQAEPRFTPFLWQRGLSYYYNEQYDLARQQFRTDVSVNPLDVAFTHHHHHHRFLCSSLGFVVFVVFVFCRSTANCEDGYETPASFFSSKTRRTSLAGAGASRTNHVGSRDTPAQPQHQ